jgi:hypothetical protein
MGVARTCKRVLCPPALGSANAPSWKSGFGVLRRACVLGGINGRPVRYVRERALNLATVFAAARYKSSGDGSRLVQTPDKGPFLRSPLLRSRLGGN